MKSFIITAILLSSPSFALTLSLSKTRTSPAVTPKSGLFSTSSFARPKLGVRALPNIRNHFSAIKGSTLKGVSALTNLGLKDKTYIQIKKASLDKEFLLQANLIEQVPVQAFHGMKSRIVTFKQSQGSIIMLEASQGHTITNELPLNLILAKFPIKSEDDKSVTIDFDAGMSKLLLTGDWNTSSDHDVGYKQMGVQNSFIDEATFDEAKDRLVIRQVVTAAVPKGLLNAQSEEPIEMKYYLSPYAPDESFKPRKIENFDRLGFFSTSSIIVGENISVQLVAKFHQDKDIVFAISDNTPEEYRDTIKEAALYWNKAFGKTVVKIVDAPKGVYAPNPDYNIIQWVKNDTAGYAYADAQMDPRTGEVLHGQVFMTSVFATSSKRKAQVIANALEKQKGNVIRTISLKGFENETACNYLASEQYLLGLKALLAKNASDAQFLRFSQDYLRHTVAHEIGHVLGLRHNFAGSLAVNYPLSKRESLFNDYFQSGKAPKEMIVSSSQMDYIPYYERAILGAQSKDKDVSAALYDERAIQTLYEGKTFANEEIPLFCTDDHVDDYADCNRFDTGRSIIEFYTFNVFDSLKNLPSSFAESIHKMVSPSSEFDAKSIDRFDVNVKQITASLMANYTNILSLFTDKAKLISIRRNFPAETTLLEDEIEAKEQDYVQSEVNRLGGLDKVMPIVAEDYAEDAFEKFVTLIDSDLYQSDEGIHELSPQDLAKAKSRVKLALDKIQQGLPAADVAALGHAAVKEKLSDTGLTEELANFFAHRAIYYISRKIDGETIEARIQVKSAKKDSELKWVTLVFPKYRFPTQVRSASVDLLSSERTSQFLWGKEQHAALKGAFENELNSLMPEGVKFSELDYNTFPKEAREAAKWVKDQKSILGKL